MSSKKWTLILAVLIIASMILTACPAPEAQVVEKIVTQPGSVDVSGEFDLLIAQTDNVEVGNGDGVLIDDLNIEPYAAGYELTQIVPGQAGTVNTIEVEGGTPGQNTTFAYALVTGSFNVPSCAGLTVDLNWPTVLGTGTADGTGHAELSMMVPAVASGLTAHVQAVELATCQKTNLYTITFP